jgi:hypothetical protein
MAYDTINFGSLNMTNQVNFLHNELGVMIADSNQFYKILNLQPHPICIKYNAIN